MRRSSGKTAEEVAAMFSYITDLKERSEAIHAYGRAVRNRQRKSYWEIEKQWLVEHGLVKSSVYHNPEAIE